MHVTLTSDIVKKTHAIVYDSMWIKIRTLAQVSRKKNYITIRKARDWKSLKYNGNFQ